MSWIGELRHSQTLRADLIAGITVALVLVPQSMAYAQLAGLPVQYGLYASFLPPMVAALFGSSRQLATGPVAVVSLMTAAAIGPLVAANPQDVIVYAGLLALMVGLFQLLLGLLSLGILVDLLHGGHVDRQGEGRAHPSTLRCQSGVGRAGACEYLSGAFSGYPVSGSFSRSAVSINAGAVTGFSSVVTGLVVATTLLWPTPLLYHLPQATLAAVITMAVINLIKIQPIIHAWKAERTDGVVAVVTFALTLLRAPHLHKGILAGVGLSLILFLLRSMRPRFAILSRFEDGTLRDIAVHPLPTSPKISIVRFDGPLDFANAGYFETRVLGVVADNPELEFIIVDGQGIKQLDATGEEVLHHLAERLRAQGIEILVARMKKQFMDTIRRTGLSRIVGEDHFFSRVTNALQYAWDQLGDRYDRTTCPLRNVSAA